MKRKEGKGNKERAKESKERKMAEETRGKEVKERR